MARMLLAIAVAVTMAFTVANADLAADQKLFAEFKKKYNKSYKSSQEEGVRFGVFQENMRKAEELHKQNPLAEFGVNEFADETASEFKVRHNAEPYFKYRMSQKKNFVTPYTKEEIQRLAGSQQVDWRKKGAVTGIKNQGRCGGCWAFSSTGNIEGQWFLAGHSLTSLSEQNLISCDTTNYGCDGGIMDTAWEWLISAQNGGIATEASYPFASIDGTAPACQSPSASNYGAYIDGHHDVTPNEDQMAAYCAANGPVSIAIDATSFQTYKSGILTNCISQKVDHAVLIVGFDDTNTPPYWIIKNSWGTTWGEDGYIRVEKGTDQCLITTIPCSAKVGSSPPPVPPSPPTPPTPPSPPTPTTPPSPPTPGGDFTQTICSFPGCGLGCKTSKLPESTCLETSSGTGSAKGVCMNGVLHLTFYSASTSCTGASTTEKLTSGTCYNDQQGGSVEYTCPSGTASAKKVEAAEKINLPALKAAKKQ